MASRTGQAKPRISRILVPTGGSRVDAEAIRLACDLARKHKARVDAVYVIEVKRSLALDADLPGEVQRGEDVLARAEQVAEEERSEIETEILQAREVGPAIVDEAMQRNAQLIIMGVEYKRHFGEFTLGRTVQYVLKNAPCQVVVCREPQLQDLPAD